MLAELKIQLWGADMSAPFPLSVLLSFMCTARGQPGLPAWGAPPDHRKDTAGSISVQTSGGGQASALLAVPTDLLVTVPRGTHPSHPYHIGPTQLPDRDRRGHLSLLDFSSAGVLTIPSASLCAFT